MDAQNKELLLQTARRLRPKYGGNAYMAVNQASLVLAIWLDKDELAALAEEVGDE